MPKNKESINDDLFRLLKVRGYSPTLLDVSGEEVAVPEEAEVFQFDFISDDINYGKVTVTIDGLRNLVVYYNDDVAKSKNENNDKEDWSSLRRILKKFAKRRQLGFELKNLSHLKSDMAKRDYMKNKEKISEGYYPMGKKASYSDAIPTVKIVIEHSRQIEEGEARYRNINRIFLENQLGERFLLDTKKPGVARVYARHISEGGKVNDQRWGHISSLVEEYTKMAGFVRATRNNQFNESAQKLVNEGIQHYQKLRETLSRMTGHRGYNAYFESWAPSLMEDDTDATSINELFVQETLDPRIESVMPILSRLQKQVSEMKEVSELSEWADKIISEDDLDEATDLLSIPQEGLDELAEEEMEEGIGDIAKKVGGALKSAGKKALDVVAPGDEELLRQLKKSAGVRNPQTGKPSMAYSDVEKREEGVAEDLDTNQKRVGQLGPTEKVGKKGAVGKLVGANESVEQGVAEGGKKPHPKTWHDVDSKLGKQVDKMSPKEKVKKGYANPNTLKKDVKEGQEDLDAILRIIRK